MEASASASQRKKTAGRQKIPIQKIDKKKNLQVCFSKRSRGLFKKAGEMSVLCGVKVAVIAFSPGGKPHSFANSSVQEVLHQYFRGLPPAADYPETPDNRVVQAEPVAEPPAVVAEVQDEMAMPALAGGASAAEPFERQVELQQLEYWFDEGFEEINNRVSGRIHELSTAGGRPRPEPITLLDVATGGPWFFNSFSSSSWSSSSSSSEEEELKKSVYARIDQLWAEEWCAIGASSFVDMVTK